MKSNSVNKKTRFTQYAVISTLLLLLISTPVFAEQESIEMLRQMGKAFASIADKASPAVVAIQAERVVLRRSQYQIPDLFDDDILEYFLPPQRDRQDSQRNQRQQIEPVKASGFIISADGYILTNNHVIEDARNIQVTLNDGREMNAEVTGADPNSDVAVIKIDAENLPFLELADSDTLEVGEWVLAIGCPLELSHTVTAGIVSAIGRSGFELAELENFIQTDAAINFGNSGGPLINLDGQVVGMNTAIASPTGDIGIGFAIPSNMAQYVAEQVIESGTVEWGLLGVFNKTLTSYEAPSFGLDEDTKGVIVSEVIEGTAAADAELKHNDVILKFNGETVESSLDLQMKISMTRPDTEIELTVWRDDQEIVIPVTVGRRESAQASSEQDDSPLETVDSIGISVQNLSDELAELYGYEGQTGVIITDVEDGSDAARKGLERGVLIKEVDRQEISDTTDFVNAIERAKDRGLENTVLYVYYEGSHHYVTLPLP